VYQHIDVLELQKDNEFSVGKQLRIGGKYTYTDLDELIVDHVKAMARKVDEMMQHDKYQKGSRADTGKFLCLIFENSSVTNYGYREMVDDLSRGQPQALRVRILSRPQAPRILLPVLQSRTQLARQLVARPRRAECVRADAEPLSRHEGAMQRLQAPPHETVILGWPVSRELLLHHITWAWLLFFRGSITARLIVLSK
jgi:transcription elongation factor SPT6